MRLGVVKGKGQAQVRPTAIRNELTLKPLLYDILEYLCLIGHHTSIKVVFM